MNEPLSIQNATVGREKLFHKFAFSQNYGLGITSDGTNNMEMNEIVDFNLQQNYNQFLTSSGLH